MLWVYILSTLLPGRTVGPVHYRHTQGVRCCGFTSCQHCFQVGQWDLYTTDTHRELGVVGLHPVNTVTRSDSGTCTIHTYVHREFGQHWPPGQTVELVQYIHTQGIRCCEITSCPHWSPGRTVGPVHYRHTQGVRC